MLYAQSILDLVFNHMTSIPDPEHFFLETPLYEKFELTDSNYACVIRIEFYQGTLDTFCPECGKESVFRSTAELPLVGPKANDPVYVEHMLEYYRGGWFPRDDGRGHREIDFVKYVSKDKVIDVIFKCSRDASHQLYFVLKIRSSILQKIGQHPSLADLQKANIKRYTKVLGHEKSSEFTRAIGLSAHGIGIGSFIYLRRIFEELIESAYSEAKQDIGLDEEDFVRARMDEKIAMLREYLPSFLVENRSMYSILSVGVHSLSEQECLNFFEPLKLAIEIMLDQKLEKQRRERKEAKTRKTLADIHRKLGK